MSTYREKGHTRVFFNRDELISRKKEIEPQFFTSDAGNYICPIDPEGGGTWMGIHSRKWFLCLLNYYPQGKIIRGSQFRSRGLLVKDILNNGILLEPETITKLILDAPYPPFSILQISKDQATGYQWDGQQILQLTHPIQFLTSSGHASLEIQQIRGKAYEDLERPLEKKTLEQFHRSRDRNRPEVGICMQRPEARTQSIAHIEITPTKIQMDYFSHPNFDTPKTYLLED